jgi:hypothetical protein
MAADLGALSDEDRADFEQRLETFGLDASSLLAPSLQTTKSSITSLALSPTPSAYTPIILRTSSFDDLNQWIGVPDEVFDDAAPVVELPDIINVSDDLAVRPGVDKPKRVRERTNVVAREVEQLSVQDLASQDLQTLRTAGRAYLRGDSRVVATYRPLLELVFANAQIAVWPFLDVTVRSGSVLEFGPGQHALVAHRVTIERGGVIRSHGNLNVSATVLERAAPFRYAAIDSALLEHRRFGNALFDPSLAAAIAIGEED